MKKVIILFSVILLMVLVNVFCIVAFNNEDESGAKYDIVFWAKNESNVTQQNIYEQIIADFESYYPDINVTIQHYSNYQDIYRDVIMGVSSGDVPNVCITYPDHIATYMTGEDVMVPLDDYIFDPDYGLGGELVAFDSTKYSEISEKFLEEGKIGGVQYALPFVRSTEAIYINKDYVEKLGYELPEVLSWEFIWEVSERAMEKNADGTFKVNGQKDMIPFIYKSTDNMMISMLKQLGADYSTDEGDILIFNEQTKDVLFEIADHAKTRAFSTFGISSYPGNWLNQGKCIFAIDSTAGATWMGPEAPNIDVDLETLVDFDVAVRMIPQYDTENPLMISQGPSICIFNREDEGEVLASWLFAQFLLTDEAQISYASTEGYIPVTTRAQQSEAYQHYLDSDKEYRVKLDATKLLLNNIDNTFITPVFNGSADLRAAAGELIEEVVKGVRRKKDVNDAFIESLYVKIIDTHSLNEFDRNENAMDNGSEAPVEKSVDPFIVAVLISIVVIWILIAIYLIYNYLKKRKKALNS